MDKGASVSRAEAESTQLKELLERYLAEVTPLKKGAEPETNRLRLMMRNPLARRFVAGVRGVDIARWRDERLRKVTPATVKRDLVLLGHVFELACKESGIYVNNPVRDIKLPPGGRPRDRRLQLGEEAHNGWLLPMVHLALETAMRQGKLLRLRWEHIDLSRRTAHLPDTENGEARSVPLSTTAARERAEHHGGR
jgi:integrase